MRWKSVRVRQDIRECSTGRPACFGEAPLRKGCILAQAEGRPKFRGLKEGENIQFSSVQLLSHV